MITNLLVGVSIPLVLAGQGASSEWARLAPKGQGFSILMPGSVTKNHAVNFAAFLTRLRRLGYSGPLIIECERAQHRVQDVLAARTYLEKIVANL